MLRGECMKCNVCRVGHNLIYTVHIQYFWQGNHQIYGAYIRFWPTLNVWQVQRMDCSWLFVRSWATCDECSVWVAVGYSSEADQSSSSNEHCTVACNAITTASVHLRTYELNFTSCLFSCSIAPKKQCTWPLQCRQHSSCAPSHLAPTNRNACRACSAAPLPHQPWWNVEKG